MKPLLARPSSLEEWLLLFYRYMLPHVTSEAYSWADPSERIFGFKTGENSVLSRLKPAFSRKFHSHLHRGLSVGLNGGWIHTRPMDPKSMVVIQSKHSASSQQMNNPVV